MAVPSTAEAEEEEVDEEVQEEEEGAVGGLKEVVVLARTLVGLRNENVLSLLNSFTECFNFCRFYGYNEKARTYPSGYV